MKKQIELFNEKIKESGFELEKPVEIREIKSTVKFELS
jgi:ribosomal protein L29